LEGGEGDVPDSTGCSDEKWQEVKDKKVFQLTEKGGKEEFKKKFKKARLKENLLNPKTHSLLMLVQRSSFGLERVQVSERKRTL